MFRLNFLSGLFFALGLFSLTGCYTKLGTSDPYSSYDYYGNSGDNWSEVYYVFLPYSPWEPYPGSKWWYHDYHCYWDVVGHYDDFDEYDAVRGRYGWDRGPGAPSTPRIGVGGGVAGGGGGSTPDQTATPQSKNPARKDKAPPKPSEEKKPEPTEEKKRNSWRR